MEYIENKTYNLSLLETISKLGELDSILCGIQCDDRNLKWAKDLSHNLQMALKAIVIETASPMCDCDLCGYRLSCELYKQGVRRIDGCNSYVLNELIKSKEGDQ